MILNRSKIISLAILLSIFFASPTLAQVSENAPIDSSHIGQPINKADTLVAPQDSVPKPHDSSKVAVEKELPPPIKLIDTLVAHFARHAYRFDVNKFDLYPRNAAGFLSHEASYLMATYSETPSRTTVSPFGLNSAQLNIQSGENQVRPYDRVIPADGKIDYDDIATGDVVSASLVEGPLSGYSSLDGGFSMLYLEPYPIPEGKAKSEFTVERGAYGYAYTRARVARMLTNQLGFSFSTDYRNGDDLNEVSDDDSYNIKTRLLKKYRQKTTINLYVNVYRRRGGFLVEPILGGGSFRRWRVDHQAVFSVSQQEFAGGQLTGRFEYRDSRSQYSTYSSRFFHTIKPHFYQSDVSYLVQRLSGLYELSIGGGKEKYEIETLKKGRNWGYGKLAGYINHWGGQLFFFGRLRQAEGEDIGLDGAAGLTKEIDSHWQIAASTGFLTGWPDLADKYASERSGYVWTELGTYTEKGNLQLESEKKLTGNVILTGRFSHTEWSASLNTGIADNMIYYDRQYDESGVTVFPSNDNVRFSDLNLRGSVRDIGPLFASISVTGRRVHSERYGNRPPYSPRWQVYTQAGIKHFIERYKINVRLFGDVTYCEKPLSYQLVELEKAAIVTGGFNASLKDLTFYYMVHNLLDQYDEMPEGYARSGWYYSWGINWKFLD